MRLRAFRTASTLSLALLAAPLASEAQSPAKVPRIGVLLAGGPFHAVVVGRLSAKHVQRILAGTAPRDLPVESVDRLALVINLKTAKALGLTIPRSILNLADQVIQ